MFRPRPIFIIALFSLGAAPPSAIRFDYDDDGRQDADVAAIVKARQAVLSSPDAEAPRLDLATLYLKMGQNHHASSLLLDYANAHPKSAATLRLLALSYLREENYTAAGDYAQRVPGDAATTAFYQLADAYRKLNRAPDADKALASFSGLSHKRADDRARDMRSRSAYEQGMNLLTNTDELDKAYQLFEQAPCDPSYYLKGNDAEALKLIREALRLNPLEAEYYFVLARCLQASDKTAALSAVRTAISLHPGVADFAELEAELTRIRH